MIRSVILKECEGENDFSKSVDLHLIELQDAGSQIIDIKYHSNIDPEEGCLYSSVLIVYRELK